MKNTRSGPLSAYILFMIFSLITGGTTVALFTSTTSNTGNSFTAGRLEIALDQPNGVHYFDIENLAPGDSGESPLVVINTGSLDLQFSIETILTGTLAEGHYPLVVSIMDSGGNPLNLENKHVLTVGEAATLIVTWHLPLQAGNEYQGASAQLGIRVLAEQIIAQANPAPEPLPGENEQCDVNGNVMLCASVSNATPRQNTWVTVYARKLVDGVPVSGEAMHSTWYYRTSSPTCDAAIDNPDGVGACERFISRASLDHTVEIHVTIGEHTVITGFTPSN